MHTSARLQRGGGGRWRIAVLALIVCCGSAIFADDTRLDAPDADAIAAAAKLVREGYAADFLKARAPDARSELAQSLLAAADTETDAANRYAMLQIGRDTAAGAGDWLLASRAIDSMDTVYKIDALKMKCDTAVVVGRSVAVDERTALADEMLPVVDSAILQDRYDLAEPLADLVLTWSRGGDQTLVKRATARVQSMKDATIALPAVQKAQATLDDTPLDGDANLKVGSFRCFIKGDWDSGIPMLALGSDPLLKSLAARELVENPPAAEITSIADGWWDAANNAPQEKDVMREHAANLYQRALPGLVGLGRFHATDRLKQVPATTIDALAGADLPTRQGINAALKWMAHIQRPDGSWTFNFPGQESHFENSVVATGMTLIPFLRAGQTDREGDYRGTVKKGLQFLIGGELAAPEGGDLRGGAKDDAMYVQAYATQALCYAFARTRDFRQGKAAQAAVNFIINSQGKSGGWGYNPHDTPGDTCITSLQLATLRLATEEARLQVPSSTFTAADRYLDTVQTNTSAEYLYNHDQPQQTITMTAAGLMSRLRCGHKPDDAPIVAGAAIVIATGFTEEKLYFDYYGTELLHRVGGDKWTTWRDAGKTIVLAHQLKDGDLAGSFWGLRDLYEERAGPLGETTIATQILEEMAK